MPNLYKTLKAEKFDLGVIVMEQMCISTKGKENEVASTILAGYERTNMTGFNADNGVLEVKAIDEQNMCIRVDTFGTLTTDGSSPKHNNRVCEIRKVGQISNDGSQYGTVISESGLSSTLSAGTHGYANNCIQQQYRIRKLTPLECWRLMDFTDEDFYKAEEVNSNTQLYKQAGNSIIKNVLVAIFGQMIPGKENIYKEME